MNSEHCIIPMDDDIQHQGTIIRRRDLSEEAAVNNNDESDGIKRVSSPLSDGEDRHPGSRIQLPLVMGSNRSSVSPTPPSGGPQSPNSTAAASTEMSPIYAPHRAYPFLFTPGERPIPLCAENEKLRKLKQKKERKEARNKEKNVKASFTASGSNEQYSIDEVMDLLGDSGKEEKKSKKSKNAANGGSGVKNSSASSGKSDNSNNNGASAKSGKNRKKPNKDSDKKKLQNNNNEEEDGGEDDEDGEVDNNSSQAKTTLLKSAAGATASSSTEDVSVSATASEADTRPQIDLDFHRNTVIIEPDLKRQMSKSSENLTSFTTVTKKKWKKRSAAAADDHSLDGGSSSRQSFVPDYRRSGGPGYNLRNNNRNNISDEPSVASSTCSSSSRSSTSRLTPPDSTAASAATITSSSSVPQVPPTDLDSAADFPPLGSDIHDDNASAASADDLKPSLPPSIAETCWNQQPPPSSVVAAASAAVASSHPPPAAEKKSIKPFNNNTSSDPPAVIEENRSATTTTVAAAATTTEDNNNNAEQQQQQPQVDTQLSDKAGHEEDLAPANILCGPPDITMQARIETDDGRSKLPDIAALAPLSGGTGSSGENTPPSPTTTNSSPSSSSASTTAAPENPAAVEDSENSPSRTSTASYPYDCDSGVELASAEEAYKRSSRAQVAANANGAPPILILGKGETFEDWTPTTEIEFGFDLNEELLQTSSSSAEQQTQEAIRIDASSTTELAVDTTSTAGDVTLAAPADEATSTATSVTAPTPPLDCEDGAIVSFGQSSVVPPSPCSNVPRSNERITDIIAKQFASAAPEEQLEDDEEEASNNNYDPRYVELVTYVAKRWQGFEKELISKNGNIDIYTP